MPRDIRLALRIRGDHYHWRITPEDAAMNVIIEEWKEGPPIIFLVE